MGEKTGGKAKPGEARRNPGDEATPGTSGTGEDVCPTCHGSGRVDGRECEKCGGSGRITRVIGGA